MSDDDTTPEATTPEATAPGPAGPPAGPGSAVPPPYMPGGAGRGAGRNRPGGPTPSANPAVPVYRPPAMGGPLAPSATPPGYGGPPPSGPPPGYGAGPGYGPGRRPTPAAVDYNTLAVTGVMAGYGGPLSDRPTLAYKRTAQSPVVPMIVYILTLIGCIFAMFALLASVSDSIEFSDTGAVSNTGDAEFALYAGWFAITLVIGTAFVWWFARMGANTGSYTAGPPLACAFPIWIWLMSWVPILNLVMLIVQICWPIRLLSQGLADAGGLPRWVGLLGWAPMLTCIGAPISLLYWLAVPVIVTITQHIGIAADRRLERDFAASRPR